MYVSALKNKQILLQLTVDFSHLKRYYFDMKTRRPAPDDFYEGRYGNEHLHCTQYDEHRQTRNVRVLLFQLY